MLAEPFSNIYLALLVLLGLFAVAAGIESWRSQGRRSRRKKARRARRLFSKWSRSGSAGTQSPIEARLLKAMEEIPGLPLPALQHEIRNQGRLVTVPDFAYPERRIAIYCDGYAHHGNRRTLEKDAKKRNWLQRQGWVVLTYWGRTHQLRRPLVRQGDLRDLPDEVRSRVNTGSGRAAPDARGGGCILRVRDRGRVTLSRGVAGCFRDGR